MRLSCELNCIFFYNLTDVPEGCTIIREHIPITNLFTCVWFNEVDRFTSRDQLSFAIARDKIREKVDWSINMFLDCERRNFVKQVKTEAIADLFSVKELVWFVCVKKLRLFS